MTLVKNLEFWELANDFRLTEDAETRKQKAKDMYETYVKVCASKELNFAGHMRSTIEGNLSNGDVDMFDAPQKMVLKDLYDVWTRFRDLYNLHHDVVTPTTNTDATPLLVN